MHAERNVSHRASTVPAMGVLIWALPRKSVSNFLVASRHRPCRYEENDVKIKIRGRHALKSEHRGGVTL
jgi:hypothetical protein